MYDRLTTQLVLDADKGPLSEVSQSVQMNDGNAVRANVVVVNLAAVAAVEVMLQGSNDLENWQDLQVSATSAGLGNNLLSAVVDVSVAYVRLHFSIEKDGAIAVLASGLNVSNQ